MGTDAGRLGAFSARRLDDRAVDEFLGLCRGVLMDGEVQEKEIVRLEGWCAAHRATLAQWPLDVIATRLLRILEDGIVEDAERADLASLLHEVVGNEPSDPEAAASLPITNPPPPIVFAERDFCFTGTFVFGNRKTCEAAVVARKGHCRSSIYPSLSYLVIGSRATKAWMHSSYGRKVEEAVALVRDGAALVIISEEHWTRALDLAAPQDPEEVRRILADAIQRELPVEFLYRGSRRIIQPSALVTWLNQPSVEGIYLGGDSADPARRIRTYLLNHIAELQVHTN